ncbi:uncharacterized protein LOC132902848 isoform X1 [Amyelois transitella]|uniref:uncharacterized protein LOC132902848 isoform X1 n=1 Tax=Amyelois transitella TaxID=680683 RepID=UPI0029900E2F|nr:uncharacterized protein LOC132902848 isoform X1 [Amyelois transitella]
MIVVNGNSLSEPERAEQAALREYYDQNDYLLSAEGVLKMVSVIACIVVSVFYLSAEASQCSGAPALASGAGVVALVAAGVAALLYAGTALQLPLYAPQVWLFADIIISTVLGVLLLVMAILSLVFCESTNFLGFLRAPLGMVAAGLAVGSAGVTFAGVTRRWDAASAREPRRPAPVEQEA